MNYYYRQKEEKIHIIRLLSSNPQETIEQLDGLQDKYSIEKMLPFYDFIIDMLKAGEMFNKKSIVKYYDLYSKTLVYNGGNLNYAVQALKYSVFDPFKDIYKGLKWHQKLRIKIKLWFSRLLRDFLIK